MSAESFSDSYIASIMNRHFVCIKVDREERPDIDQTYLEAIHMFNQSAGWPLHAFCLPDGRPFGEEHTSLKKIMIMALLHGHRS